MARPETEIGRYQHAAYSDDREYVAEWVPYDDALLEHTMLCSIAPADHESFSHHQIATKLNIGVFSGAPAFSITLGWISRHGWEPRDQWHKQQVIYAKAAID